MSILESIIKLRENETANNRAVIENLLKGVELAQNGAYKGALTDNLLAQADYRAMANKIIKDSMNPAPPSSETPSPDAASGAGLLDSLTPNQPSVVLKGIGPQGPTFVNPKAPTTGVDEKQVAAIADAIVSGDQPPELSRLYKFAGPVKAELAVRKFDLTKATRDWTAVQKTIGALNSTQQVRMRQALDSVELGISSLQEASEALNRSGLKDVNWVTVNAALRGIGPQKEAATKYLTQINVMKDELAQGFMGGGVPTDRAFKLADDVLQPLYGKQQLGAALDQLGYNLTIRKKAITGITPLSIGGEVDNPKLSGSSAKTGSGYVRTGTLPDGRKVGMKADRTVEVIQ